MRRVLEIGDRDLVRPPSALDRLAIDEFWPGPSFRGAKDDHWPARAFESVGLAGQPRGVLNLADPRQNHIQRTGERLVHQRRIIAFDEMRIVATAAQQVGELLAADADQHCRIGDLETIEVQDWQDRAIACRGQKLVGMPAGGEGARFCFTVTDDAGDDQVWIVEGGAVGMEQRIAQLAAFMDRAGRFRRYMTGYSIGPGELAEEPLQSPAAAFDRRVALGV